MEQNKKRHPKDMSHAEIEAFLTHLAVEGNVAASTQNQAMRARPACISATTMIYTHVLNRGGLAVKSPLD